MALNSSPRKVVPLSSGEEWRSRPKSLPTITKRAFFCGVIVESPASGRDYSDSARLGLFHASGLIFNLFT